MSAIVGAISNMTIGSFFVTEDVRKDYDLGKVLGRGHFGTVRAGKSKRTGKDLAVKIINKHQHDVDRTMLQAELNILKKVDHPNVIKLEAIYETRSRLYIVQELVTGGELFNRIEKKGTFSEEEARFVMSQMMAGLHYLHFTGIIHRDLKPENILCDEKEGDEYIIKIMDFGLSTMLKTREGTSTTACGTPLYVAPEMIWGKAYNSKVDIWSAGVICYMLLSGYYPFYADSNRELFDLISQGIYAFPPELFQNISQDAIDFTSYLLTVNPSERPKAEEALRHKWLDPTSGEYGQTKMSVGAICKLREKAQKLSTPQVQRVNHDLQHQLYGNLTKTVKKSLDLTKEDVALLSSQGTVKTFKKGEVVLNLDAKSVKGSDLPLGYMVKGSLMTQLETCGGTITLDTANQFGVQANGLPVFFNVINVILPESMCSLRGSLTANSDDTQICFISRKTIEKLTEDNPLAATRLFRHLALLMCDRLSSVGQVVKSSEGVVVKKNVTTSETGHHDGYCTWKKTTVHHGRFKFEKDALVLSQTILALVRTIRLPFEAMRDLQIDNDNHTIRVNVGQTGRVKKFQITFPWELFECTIERLKTELDLSRRSKQASSAGGLSAEQENRAQNEEAGLNKYDLKQLLDAAELKEYKKGEVMLREGQKQNSLFFIWKGSVSVEVTDPETDKQKLIGYLYSREPFGEISFLANDEVTATVKAAEADTVVYVFEGSRVFKRIEMFPAFGARFYRYLSFLIAARVQRTLHKSIKELSYGQ